MEKKYCDNCKRSFVYLGDLHCLSARQTEFVRYYERDLKPKHFYLPCSMKNNYGDCKDYKEINNIFILIAKKIINYLSN